MEANPRPEGKTEFTAGPVCFKAVFVAKPEDPKTQVIVPIGFYFLSGIRPKWTMSQTGIAKSRIASNRSHDQSR